MTDHVNVLIIGAGISGIGVACHLRMRSPEHSFAILEGRDAIGGTWDLFRYPGIRSDSDMYTFGYRFKPWVDDRDIATGEAILDYLQETVEEYELGPHIRFGHRVERLVWSSDARRWEATVTRTADDSTVTVTADFLVTGTGYYDYERGYTPNLPGLDRFAGPTIHPQHWPEDLDYEGKRVVVVGSGATAVTLVPSMAREAAHVTMLQRSPTYMYVRPRVDAIAKAMRTFLPARTAHMLSRFRNVGIMRGLFALSRFYPGALKRALRKMAEDGLGPEFDIDRHFSPSYDPWDQRLCLVPDGDLYEAIRSGEASIVTDGIAHFDEAGVVLTSGARIDADIVVLATGLEMKFLPNVEVVVDGEPVMPGDLITYKGAMFANMPNWVAVFGYSSASWTLKADLVSEFLCRVLQRMREGDFDVVVPTLEGEDAEGERRTLWANLKSGYIQRGTPRFPKQLDRQPWVYRDEYLVDIFTLRYAPLDDGILRFERGAPRARAELESAAAVG